MAGLEDAAIQNNLPHLQSILESPHPPPIDSDLKSGRTALSFAARHGSLDCVRYLLEHAATVDAPDTINATPLLFAAEHGHVSTLQLLLGHRADPCTPLFDDTSPLFLATQNGHLQSLKILLHARGDIYVARRGAGIHVRGDRVRLVSWSASNSC